MSGRQGFAPDARVVADEALMLRWVQERGAEAPTEATRTAPEHDSSVRRTDRPRAATTRPFDANPSPWAP